MNNTITINNLHQGVTVDLSPFQYRAPKPEGVKAAKLTKKNIGAVAAHIRESLDILKTDKESVNVTVDNRSISYPDGFRSGYFEVGQWVLEEWDYVHDKATFRVASIDERKQYDPR